MALSDLPKCACGVTIGLINGVCGSCLEGELARLRARVAEAEAEVERLRGSALTEEDIKACARRFAVDGMEAEAALTLAIQELTRERDAALARAEKAEGQ